MEERKDEIGVKGELPPRLEVKVKKLKRGTIGSEGRVPTELSVATRTHGGEGPRHL